MNRKQSHTLSLATGLHSQHLHNRPSRVQSSSPGIVAQLQKWFRAHFGAAPVTAARPHAVAGSPLYDREFATEAEAMAFSRSLDGQEYRTSVQQDVYDYTWYVEVYRATPGR